MLDVAKEGDLLLSMFQTEFRKMNSELVDKQVRLFHHMFHHLFSSRLAKLEQFLVHHYDDFATFEPNYSPINNNNNTKDNKSSSSSSSSSAAATADNKKDQGILPRDQTSKSRAKTAAEILKQELDSEDSEQEQEINLNDYVMEGDDQDEEEYDGEEELENGEQEQPVVFCTDFIIGNDSQNPLQSDEELSESYHQELLNADGQGKKIKAKRIRIRKKATDQVSTNVNKGRKRHPIWSMFDTTYHPNMESFSGLEKAIKHNQCRLCGQHVSPKTYRLSAHILKCIRDQEKVKSKPTVKLSHEVAVYLQRFQVKLTKQKKAPPSSTTLLSSENNNILGNSSTSANSAPVARRRDRSNTTKIEQNTESSSSSTLPTLTRFTLE